MPIIDSLQPVDASRREFLSRASILSLAAGAAPWAMTLAAIGEAAAQSADDYKALVCVFLYGGNDYANTLVPYDSASHTQYLKYRSNIAIRADSLGATLLVPSDPLPGGVQYALHPGLAPLLPIFDSGRLAPILNIGTLMRPTTKAEYANKSVPLPPKLFSHNDQQSFWQASSPEGATSGWGGRLGDLFAAGNGNASFTCINVSGNAVYLSGQNAVQYQVTSSGSVAIAGIKAPLFGSAACSNALRDAITAVRPHLLENEYAVVARRSISANDQLSAALGNVSIATAFPAGNSLGDQLKMVARIIGARQALGVKRQVFLVSLGGFDTHSNLLETHSGLMTHLGNALAAFYQATQELGVARNVTTFTGTDFGRTLASNSSGTDHGWGGVQFVLGEGVLGGRFVGTPPVLGNNGPDDVGQGRLLPALAVDQMAATLAIWFGVSSAELVTVLPNIGSFSQRDLGFAAPLEN